MQYKPFQQFIINNHPLHSFSDSFRFDIDYDYNRISIRWKNGLPGHSPGLCYDVTYVVDNVYNLRLYKDDEPTYTENRIHDEVIEQLHKYVDRFGPVTQVGSTYMFTYE